MIDQAKGYFRSLEASQVFLDAIKLREIEEVALHLPHWSITFAGRPSQALVDWFGDLFNKNALASTRMLSEPCAHDLQGENNVMTWVSFFERSESLLLSVSLYRSCPRPLRIEGLSRF